MVIVCTGIKITAWNMMSQFKHIWSEVFLIWHFIQLIIIDTDHSSLSIPGHISNVS
jgi:hypothetical protein